MSVATGEETGSGGKMATLSHTSQTQHSEPSSAPKDASGPPPPCEALGDLCGRPGPPPCPYPNTDSNLGGGLEA